MNSVNLIKEYHAKTDDELLRLAKDADKLTPEASAYLMSEMAARGLQTAAGTGPVAPPAIVSGKDPLAVEIQLPTDASKPPWRPKTAGWIAFWFGPVAGALVVAASLRRIGHEQRARKVMILAFVAGIAEVAILSFVPEGVGHVLGFAGHIGFLLLFPPLMEAEFNGWQAAHEAVEPANGWKALGWAIGGAVAIFAIAFIMEIGLSFLLPGRE
ncbi:MAG TPA: hypothetical protein VFR08_15945 [Candidatus Angelobacter sp.]|nr:hypothetical protein [Candidatus Angelobacter sp.]